MFHYFFRYCTFTSCFAKTEQTSIRPDIKKNVAFLRFLLVDTIYWCDFFLKLTDIVLIVQIVISAIVMSIVSSKSHFTRLLVFSWTLLSLELNSFLVSLFAALIVLIAVSKEPLWFAESSAIINTFECLLILKFSILILVLSCSLASLVIAPTCTALHPDFHCLLQRWTYALPHDPYLRKLL